jgi:hypothetical protein
MKNFSLPREYEFGPVLEGRYPDSVGKNRRFQVSPGVFIFIPGTGL